MNWDQYQENIVILGLQGSGKTTLAKSILATIPRRPRLIISPQRPLDHYGKYGNPVNRIKDIHPNGAWVWTDYGHDEQTLIDKLSERIMRFSNFLVVVDDAHEFASKQKIPPRWKRLINSGRNRGITSIMISTMPNQLNNVILQSSQHLFSFPMALESQVEYSRKNFFGDMAYLLLPYAARPYAYKEYDLMRKHERLYRHVASPYVVHYAENGEGTVMRSVDDFPRKAGAEQRPEEPAEPESAPPPEAPESTEAPEDKEAPENKEGKESNDRP